MLNKKHQQSLPSSRDSGTIICNNIVLENVVIKGLGTVRIDGAVSGEIQLEGHLILGETGKLSGEVHAASAMFMGSYEGNIYIEGVLHIAAGAHVDGNVRTGKLIIDEGADFHGTCNMDMAKLDSHKVISFVKEIGDEEKAL